MRSTGSCAAIRGSSIASPSGCSGSRATPDEELPDAAPSPEDALLAEEVKIRCTTGMLLCLDREQRIVFVLGEIFEVSDVQGAEILSTTRANFRQKLARAGPAPPDVVARLREVLQRRDLRSLLGLAE